MHSEGNPHAPTEAGDGCIAFGTSDALPDQKYGQFLPKIAECIPPVHPGQGATQGLERKSLAGSRVWRPLDPCPGTYGVSGDEESGASARPGE